MPRGGSRPGSGRPKGSMTKKKRLLVEEAQAHGVTPLGWMLAVLNNPEADEARRDRMAIAAAPFVHPKLVSARHDLVRGDEAARTNVFVEQISVIAVEPGRFLTSAEAREPIVEILPEPPQQVAAPLADEILDDDDDNTSESRVVDK